MENDIVGKCRISQISRLTSLRRREHNFYEKLLLCERENGTEMKYGRDLKKWMVFVRMKNGMILNILLVKKCTKWTFREIFVDFSSLLRCHFSLCAFFNQFVKKVPDSHLTRYIHRIKRKFSLLLLNKTIRFRGFPCPSVVNVFSPRIGTEFHWI